MHLQLSWVDPATGKRRQPEMEVPLAFGREFETMPSMLNGKRVSRIVLQDALVSDYHALIDFQHGELRVIDQNTSTGTYINGIQSSNGLLQDGDRLQIG